MEIICIKSGKCIKENSGFIEVNDGDKGEVVEKQRAGDVLAFINGTRVLIPLDHLNHIEKSFLACFKTIKTIQEDRDKSKVKILIEKLENLTGKKVSLK